MRNILDALFCRDSRRPIEDYSDKELREKVRSLPWMKEKRAQIKQREKELGLSGVPDVSDEWLIDQRASELIGLMVCGKLTRMQQIEYDQLTAIRVALMLPPRLRRSSLSRRSALMR